MVGVKRSPTLRLEELFDLLRVASGPQNEVSAGIPDYILPSLVQARDPLVLPVGFGIKDSASATVDEDLQAAFRPQLDVAAPVVQAEHLAFEVVCLYEIHGFDGEAFKRGQVEKGVARKRIRQEPQAAPDHRHYRRGEQPDAWSVQPR